MAILAPSPSYVNLSFEMDTVHTSFSARLGLFFQWCGGKMAKIITSNRAAGSKLNKWVTSGDTGSRQGQAILTSEPITKCKAF